MVMVLWCLCGVDVDVVAVEKGLLVLFVVGFGVVECAFWGDISGTTPWGSVNLGESWRCVRIGVLRAGEF